MASIDRRPRGTWRARWREYPGGPQRTKSFARKVDAERHLVEVQHQLYVGAYVDPSRARTMLADWWAVWSPRQPWRPSTRQRNTSKWAKHIEPAFGRHPVGSIRRGHVEDWVRGLPLAPSTAGEVLHTLGALLEGAVLDGLIPANPCRGARRPKVEHEPVVPLTAAQVDALRAAAPPWFSVTVTLGALAGLRQAEATGLTVDRARLLRREVRVDRQLLSLAGSAPTFGPPKTKRSFRTIPLADVAVERVARHIELHGTGDNGLVVHDQGKPITRADFSRLWKPTIAAAGLPVGTRFHGLRHYFASVLLQGGVSVPAAAEYLGHTPSVLLSVYGHLMPAAEDQARAVVQAATTAEDTLRTQRG